MTKYISRLLARLSDFFPTSVRFSDRLTHGKSGNSLSFFLKGGAEIARPDIARPDKTAPDQTARLNNGDHEQSSPWRIIAMRTCVCYWRGMFGVSLWNYHGHAFFFLDSIDCVKLRCRPSALLLQRFRPLTYTCPVDVCSCLIYNMTSGGSRGRMGGCTPPPHRRSGI